VKKIISFSLWGNNPKYCVGAIRNSELRQKYYPDWVCRFYVHKDVPSEYIESLQSIDGTEVVIEDRPPNWTGMFWRFEPISEEDVSVMISRDCDSRLNEREADAVSEFMNSEKLFHIMRDHPYHGFNVLGGMFGIKKGILNNMKDLDLALKYIQYRLKGDEEVIINKKGIQVNLIKSKNELAPMDAENARDVINGLMEDAERGVPRSLDGIDVDMYQKMYEV